VDALVLAVALALPADPIDPVAREITTFMAAAPDYVRDSYCYAFQIDPKFWLSDYPKPVRPIARAAWREACR
jgi:hypothetical protein